MLLSAVEYAIPKPVPFMRLGLANLPVLLALYIALSAGEYFLLVTLKVLTQALISGTLFSYVFLFSLAGSFSSAVVMWLLFRCGHSRVTGRAAFSAVGISLGGALANNMAQIALSYFLLFGGSTRYVAPVLLAVGIITATILGFFAEAFMSCSHWFAAACSTDNGDIPAASASESGNEQESMCAGTIRFCVALCIMLAFFFVQDVRVMAVMTVIFYIAARIRRRKVRIFPSFIILVTVTAAALLSPAGRVLTRIGTFPITLGALETGLSRALTLVGMVFLSQYATSGTIRLPGKAGELLENVFTWFSALSAKKLTFKKGAVIKTLDDHLYQTFFRQ